MFDDWKWKFGQPNPEPQIGAFQGMQKNPNVQSISPHINRPQSPTYGNVNTYDEAGYNTALDQEMALGTPSQTSAAQGGSVGKPTDLKTSIFDVSSGPKNTMATLEDFNVPDYPFLKKWRY
mgnify:CR=1 FL=1